MAGYGASRAMAYSDYYNNKSDTPNTNSNSDLSNQPSTDNPDTPATVAKRRKQAIQRRLRMRKVSMS